MGDVLLCLTLLAIFLPISWGQVDGTEAGLGARSDSLAPGLNHTRELEQRFYASVSARGAPKLVRVLSLLETASDSHAALLCGSGVVGGCGWRQPLVDHLNFYFPDLQIHQNEVNGSVQGTQQLNAVSELQQLTAWVVDKSGQKAVAAGHQHSRSRKADDEAPNAESSPGHAFTLAVVQLRGLDSHGGEPNCTGSFDLSGGPGLRLGAVVAAFEQLLTALGATSAVLLVTYTLEEEFAAALLAPLLTRLAVAHVSLGLLQWTSRQPAEGSLPAVAAAAVMTRLLEEWEHDDTLRSIYLQSADEEGSVLPITCKQMGCPEMTQARWQNQHARDGSFTSAQCPALGVAWALPQQGAHRHLLGVEDRPASHRRHNPTHSTRSGRGSSRENRTGIQSDTHLAIGAHGFNSVINAPPAAGMVQPVIRGVIGAEVQRGRGHTGGVGPRDGPGIWHSEESEADGRGHSTERGIQCDEDGSRKGRECSGEGGSGRGDGVAGDHGGDRRIKRGKGSDTPGLGAERRKLVNRDSPPAVKLAEASEAVEMSVLNLMMKTSFRRDPRKLKAVLQVLRRHGVDARGQAEHTRLLNKLLAGDPVTIAVWGGSAAAGATVEGCQSFEQVQASLQHRKNDKWLDFRPEQVREEQEGAGSLTAELVKWQYRGAASQLAGATGLRDPAARLGCSYSARLARILLENFPHPNHTVFNFARPGATVESVLPLLQRDIDTVIAVKQVPPGRAPLDAALFDFAMPEAPRFARIFGGAGAQGQAEAGLRYTRRNVFLLGQCLAAHEAMLRAVWQRCHGRATLLALDWAAPSPSASTYWDLLEPLLARYRVATVSLEAAHRALPAALRDNFRRALGLCAAAPAAPACGAAEPPAAPAGSEPAPAEESAPRASTFEEHQMVANLLGVYILRGAAGASGRAGRAAAARDAALARPVFCRSKVCAGDNRAVWKLGFQRSLVPDEAWHPPLRDPARGQQPRWSGGKAWQIGADQPGQALPGLVAEAEALQQHPLGLAVRYRTGVVTMTMATAPHSGGALVWMDLEESCAFTCDTPNLQEKVLATSGPGLGPQQVDGGPGAHISAVVKHVLTPEDGVAFPECLEEAGCRAYLHICPLTDMKVELLSILVE